jgi:enoyl-CoA hydratase/carnithine racemase
VRLVNLVPSTANCRCLRIRPYAPVDVRPRSDPEARAAEIAAEIASFSPTAILSGMTFVQEARGLDWRAGGEIARRIRDEVFRSEDFREGLRAFHEKRPPKWPSLRR